MSTGSDKGEVIHSNNETEYHEEDERDYEQILKVPNPTPIENDIPSPKDDTTGVLFSDGRSLQISVVNRAMIQSGQQDEGVSNCAIIIGSVSGTTNAFGNLSLDIGSLHDGIHSLTVEHPDSTNAPAGPGTPSDISKSRVWRKLEGTITISSGDVTHSEPSEFVEISGGHLRIGLQPVWIRTEFTSNRSNTPDMIVIHHTGSDNVRGNIEQLAFSGLVSVHYLVTPKGEIYKFADDSKTTWHAGYSYWQGEEQMNSHSIGIEMVHKSGAYPEAQLEAVTNLVKRIHNAFPGIPANRVIGHSDIGITRRAARPPKRHGRKSTDPGSRFPWERVEALGLGLQISDGLVSSSIYSGFFEEVPTGTIRDGDRDDQQRYGGTRRPGMNGIVREIQEDLGRIGYLTKPIDGHYGTITTWAVKMFQQHMFSGSRRENGTEHSGDGRVDQKTAEMIKRVIGEVQVGGGDSS